MYVKQNNEIVIIGGGIVGLSLALLLSPFANVKIINVKSAKNKPVKRCLAITRVSELLFEKMSAWESIKPYACAYANMQVFDDANKSNFKLKAENFAQKNIGHIIEQDVVSVNHQHSVQEMIQAGRDIERRVLTSAVKAHLEHRIILDGQRTIIFHA